MSAGDGHALLEIRDLDAGHGDLQVLWGLSLDVHEGEVVALVGANGAGKSTLLGTISQLIRPRAGTIRFAGRDLTRAGSDAVVRAGIVHVPQGRRLFSGLTVMENLLQGAYQVRDRAETQRNLDRVLSIFPRLAERRTQLAGLLSGGEQQMCAIARGLMSKPRLLMIDELSLGLAPLVVDTLMKLVVQLHETGMTILLVEQDVQVALEHADRGYVLETGRICQTSTAAELLQDPRIRRAYLGV
ncbi:MAG TPA: ABC transporter ATP-binding protein [Kofleriaceae bacterium]|nr:ABC transporter ATP-binding protein [Kofleriaceae bacterium]